MLLTVLRNGQSIATTHSAPYRHLKTKTANQRKGSKFVREPVQAPQGKTLKEFNVESGRLR